jgi:hypothetical protein
MVGLVGAMASFEAGDALLRGLAGPEVGCKQVERRAKELDAAIDRDERHSVALPEREQIAPTMYLGVDGTGIPMRSEEVAGHAGKQPDGAAKTREVKLCVVWSAEGRDADGKPVRDHGPVSYVAIGHRLKRSAMHWGVRGANTIIALRCNQLSGRFQDFWERRAPVMNSSTRSPVCSRQ